MTMTAESRDKKFDETWAPPSGLTGWFAAVSNANIGNRYIVTGLIFFLLGGFLALLMRVQLAVSGNTFLGPEVYNQLFTMHGSTMMFLFVIPCLEGLAIYILPAMLGSRDLAFPRVSAFSYWIYLFGGSLFYVSFLFGEVPDAGWYAYPPLSGAKYSGLGLDFWLIGLGFIEFGGIAAGVELVASVLKLRAPGMTLNRMPLYAWAWLVTGFMIIVAFTTLFTASLLIELDRTIQTRFFDPDHGGSVLLWQHLFWFFGHPEVYIMFIPATGMISSIVPVFARRPIAAYPLVVVAIVVTGFVSFGLWVHHMFTTGLPEYSSSFFTAASLMIAIASGIQVFAWIATLWGSRPALKVPMLYIMGFFAIFVMGGLTGVMVATVPFDWQVHDTYFLVAHFHYVLIGGVVFPLLGGFYYWLPKITGRMVNERLGTWGFWLTFLGFNVTFFPMHIMGFEGMPRRVYTYPASLGVDGLNLIATAGAFVLALGIFLFALGAALSVRFGPKAGKDPWGGDTLEWWVDSPPPQSNIHTPPIVHSRNPLWDGRSLTEGDPAYKQASEALAGEPIGWRGMLGTDVLTGKPVGIHIVSGASYAPFFAALGLLIISVGELLKLHSVSLFGLLVSIVAIAVWIWPEEQILRRARESRIDEKAGVPLLIAGRGSLGWWAMAGILSAWGVVFGNFFYSYFYIRLYSPAWPQQGLPLADLTLPLIAYAVLTVSLAPQLWACRRFRDGRVLPTGAGLAAVGGLGLLFLGLQIWALTQLPFTWRANAYASLFYGISGFLALTVAVGLGLNLMAQIRLWKEGADHQGFIALMLQCATLYWCFTVGAGVLVFATLYLSPLF